MFPLFQHQITASFEAILTRLTTLEKAHGETKVSGNVTMRSHYCSFLLFNLYSLFWYTSGCAHLFDILYLPLVISAAIGNFYHFLPVFS